MTISLLKTSNTTEPQAGFSALLDLKKPWISSFMLYKGRTIPRAKTGLSMADRLGSVKVRWDIGRRRYKVLPGIYATGRPNEESPVFVTANYKLSFDALRENLEGMNAWILVLDTKGINVWCAAGKGTFGTAELVSRIAKVKLSSLITHRVLILPQLGASGVSAPEVARQSGFRVEWGPVRAQDIPAWISVGREKTPAMREVSFDLRDRLAVAPVEIAHAWPIIPAAIILAGLFGLPINHGYPSRTLPMLILLLGTIPVGTLIFPALLPWLPSRIFVAKGAILGAIWAGICSFLFHWSVLTSLGSLLIVSPVVAFLAMNFTGSSTFTCQPGALMEVDKSFWPMLISLAVGIVTLCAARLLGL